MNRLSTARETSVPEKAPATRDQRGVPDLSRDGREGLGQLEPAAVAYLRDQIGRGDLRQVTVGDRRGGMAEWGRDRGQRLPFVCERCCERVPERVRVDPALQTGAGCKTRKRPPDIAGV